MCTGGTHIDHWTSLPKLFKPEYTLISGFIQNENLVIDSSIAYFIGVLQSDGYMYTFHDKKRNRDQIRLGLEIGIKSIPMALKFQKIFFDYFGRSVNLKKISTKTTFRIQTSVNKIWFLVKDWEREKIPDEIKNDRMLFGAYLAGWIDGDGHIKIKNNTKDRIIPQCVIRIASSHPLDGIGNLVKKYIECEVHFEFKKESRGVNTCFYISKKSIKFVEECIYPHLVMPHKIDRLNQFFNMKNEPAGIRTPISALIKT